MVAIGEQTFTKMAANKTRPTFIGFVEPFLMLALPVQARLWCM
jgi:hypothetical protein